MRLLYEIRVIVNRAIGAGILDQRAENGFVEFENPVQEQFGKRRLEDALRSSRGLLPDQIIKGLYEAVLAFSNGTKQQDDLTAVLIKRI